MRSRNRPTTITLFLCDGTPEGVRIVGRSNWTGRAVVASRAQLKQAMQREEMSRPGVYVLVGPGEDGASRLYVGEADMLGDRLAQHNRTKDFWTRFIAFTIIDENLNKAHVRFLESRPVTLAREAKQWEIENTTSPSEPPLSEADRANVESFLDEMLVIYPIVGVDAFEVAAASVAAEEEFKDLFLEERGAEGRGRDTPDGFVVRAGSKARASEVNSAPDALKETRRRLIDRGVLVPQGEHLVFTQDFRFSSPSTASAVLVGGSSNGRRAWKNATGVNLRDLP